MYKTLLKVLILVGAVAYLVFALVHFNRPEHDPECTGLDITIYDEHDTQFVNENEIRELLVQKKLFPEGQTLKDIDLAQLESVLVASPYIDRALCFKTVEGKISIQVTPRVPVLHVLNAAGEDFYIDNVGGTMPRGHHAIDLPVITGAVDLSTAGKLYSHLGVTLAGDSFWAERVGQLHIAANGDIELTPTVGDFTIILGDTSCLQDKLSRMQTFYTEGLNQVGWNRYKTLSVKYAGQVVATKKKNEK